MNTYAIGDIHGCLTQLRVLVEEKLPQDSQLIFLGDYVDRGPDSAGVVSYIMNLQQLRPNTICLMGNHEKMLLNDPELFMLNGGKETLESYQRGAGDTADLSVIPTDHLEWFRGLPLYHETEDSIFVHAGINVDIKEMVRQSEAWLLWVRAAFYKRARMWKGKQIFFGHTPVNYMGNPTGQVFTSHNIWGIDTGCFFTGILTAINVDTKEIIQTDGTQTR